MFCKFCGAPIPDGAKFCPKCGKSLEMVVSFYKDNKKTSKVKHPIGRINL